MSLQTFTLLKTGSSPVLGISRNLLFNGIFIKIVIFTIYCAENSLNNKKYVGLTSRTLDTRISEHFTKTIKSNHKFANALKYYPKSVWKWYILDKVSSIEKANELEIFFISDLNTFNNGYNSHPGGSIDGENHPSYNPKVIEVYHPDHGYKSGTRSELSQIDRSLKDIQKLVSGKRLRLGGWVLAENKDLYKECVKYSSSRGKKVTLYHIKHGVQTLLQCEFCSFFNLDKGALSKLLQGRLKSHKGWIVLNQIDILTTSEN